MTEKDETQEQGPQDSSTADWGKIINELWSPLFKQWSGMFQGPESLKTPNLKGRVGQSFQTTTKMWQTALDAMSEPAALEHFQKAAKMAPDITLGFTQSCLQSFTGLQSQVRQWIQKRSASLSAADVQELDKELIQKWIEVYEKEFSQYLRLPQIGLGRFYQERALQAADKMSALQGALSAFLHMLAQPIERSFNSLQEKMVEMTAEGPIDEKSKTYYNLWVRLLEGHYMELFKQPEYSVVMAKTLDALNQYVEARQAVVNDLLKQFNVPTHQDLDDLYKEIYLLKKRMRVYEKRS